MARLPLSVLALVTPIAACDIHTVPVLMATEVTVTESGRCAVHGTAVACERLAEFLRSENAQDDCRVTLAISPKASSELAISVVTSLQRARFTNVVFAPEEGK